MMTLARQIYVNSFLSNSSSSFTHLELMGRKEREFVKTTFLESFSHKIGFIDISNSFTSLKSYGSLENFAFLESFVYAPTKLDYVTSAPLSHIWKVLATKLDHLTFSFASPGSLSLT